MCTECFFCENETCSAHVNFFTARSDTDYNDIILKCQRCVNFQDSDHITVLSPERICEINEKQTLNEVIENCGFYLSTNKKCQECSVHSYPVYSENNIIKCDRLHIGGCSRYGFNSFLNDFECELCGQDFIQAEFLETELEICDFQADADCLRSCSEKTKCRKVCLKEGEECGLELSYNFTRMCHAGCKSKSISIVKINDETLTIEYTKATQAYYANRLVCRPCTYFCESCVLKRSPSSQVPEACDRCTPPYRYDEISGRCIFCPMDWLRCGRAAEIKFYFFCPPEGTQGEAGAGREEDPFLDISEFENFLAGGAADNKISSILEELFRFSNSHVVNELRLTLLFKTGSVCRLTQKEVNFSLWPKYLSGKLFLEINAFGLTDLPLPLFDLEHDAVYWDFSSFHRVTLQSLHFVKKDEQSSSASFLRLAYRNITNLQIEDLLFKNVAISFEFMSCLNVQLLGITIQDIHTIFPANFKFISAEKENQDLVFKDIAFQRISGDSAKAVLFYFANAQNTLLKNITVEDIASLSLAFLQALYYESPTASCSFEIKDFLVKENKNIDLQGFKAAFYFLRSLSKLSITGLSVLNSSFLASGLQERRFPSIVKAERSFVATSYSFFDWKVEDAKFRNVNMFSLVQLAAPIWDLQFDGFLFANCKFEGEINSETKSPGQVNAIFISYEGTMDNKFIIFNNIRIGNIVFNGPQMMNNLMLIDGAGTMIVTSILEIDNLGVTGINFLNAKSLFLQDTEFDHGGLQGEFEPSHLLYISNIETLHFENTKFSNLLINRAAAVQIFHLDESVMTIRNFRKMVFNNIKIYPNEEKSLLSTLLVDEPGRVNFIIENLSVENVVLVDSTTINSASTSVFSLIIPAGELMVSNAEFALCNQAIFLKVSKLKFLNSTIESAYTGDAKDPLPFQDEPLALGPLLGFKGNKLVIINCVFRKALSSKNGVLKVSLYDSRIYKAFLNLSNCTFEKNYADYNVILIHTLRSTSIGYDFSLMLFRDNILFIAGENSGLVKFIGLSDQSKFFFSEIEITGNFILADSLYVYFTIFPQVFAQSIRFYKLVIKSNNADGTKLYSPKIFYFEEAQFSTITLENCFFSQLIFSNGEIFYFFSGRFNTIGLFDSEFSNIEIEPFSGDRFIAFQSTDNLTLIQNKFFNVLAYRASPFHYLREPDYFIFFLNNNTSIMRSCEFHEIDCGLCVSFAKIDDGLLFISSSNFTSIKVRNFGVLWFTFGATDTKMSQIEDCLFSNTTGGKIGGVLLLNIFTNLTVKHVKFIQNRLRPHGLDKKYGGSAIYYFIDERADKDQFPIPQTYFLVIENCSFSLPLTERGDFPFLNGDSSLIESDSVSPVYLAGNTISEKNETDSESLKNTIIGSPVAVALVLHNRTENASSFFTNASLRINNIDSGRALENLTFFFHLIDENNNILRNFKINVNRTRAFLRFHQIVGELSLKTDYFFNKMNESLEVTFNETLAAFVSSDVLIYGPKNGRIFIKLELEGEFILTDTFYNFYGFPLSTHGFDKRFPRFVFEINLNPCLTGQVYKNKVCQWCSNFTYILDDKSFDCKTCQTIEGVEYCQNSTLVLHQGYWRASNYTDEVLKCANSEFNCLGGLGAQACAQGHIGPLCSECDIFGLRWNHSYSKSGKRSCGVCSEVSQNLVRIILVSLLTFCSLFVSVRSTSNFMKKTLQLKIANGMTSSQIRKNKDLGAVYMKIILNYFQVISCIWTFDIKLPQNLNFIPEIVGNPLEQLFYSVDCFLIQFLDKESTPLAYVRLLLMVASPFGYVGFFIFAYSCYRIFKRKKIKKKVVITSMLFIFLYMQTNIVDYCISLLSCIEIGKGAFFVKADLTIVCFSDDYSNYSISLVTPILLFFSLLLPGAILAFLISKRKSLHQPKLRLTFGFLYNEYSSRGFFWEFAKIYQRISLLIVLNFLARFTNLKGLIVLMLISAYGLASYYIQPYSTKSLNALDQISIFVSFFSIFSALVVYNCEAKFYVLSFAFIAAACLINIWFFADITLRALKSYYLAFLRFVKTKKIAGLKSLFRKEILKRIRTTEDDDFNPVLKRKLRRAMNKFKDLRAKYQLFFK